MAACNLKLGSFKRAFDLCSFVLNINPNNTKARLRRAKAAMEIGLTNSVFEDLTTTLSLDPNNKKIRNEMGKLVQFSTSTAKGKRKLGSFEYQEESGDCGPCRGRVLDSPYILQGSEESTVAKKSLPCMYASTVTKEDPCEHGIGVMYANQGC